MDEARTARAQMLQRKQRMEQLVSKRITNVTYLKRFHEGDHYWMNVISMSRQELSEFAQSKVPDQRILGYFYLGISLSKLLDSFPVTLAPSNRENIIKLIRGLSQLFEEFEFHFSSSAMQSVKYMMARNSACMYPNIGPVSTAAAEGPQSMSTGASVDQTAVPKPTVYKYQSDVVYEFLLTPHLPFVDSMDYVEVLSCLCAVLLRVYEAFREPQCYQRAALYDVILKIDAKVKHHVVNTVSKELTDCANETLQQELSGLRGGSLSSSF